jgi:hypothetical protein
MMCNCCSDDRYHLFFMWFVGKFRRHDAREMFDNELTSVTNSTDEKSVNRIFIVCELMAN